MEFGDGSKNGHSLCMHQLIKHQSSKVLTNGQSDHLILAGQSIIVEEVKCPLKLPTVRFTRVFNDDRISICQPNQWNIS